MCDQLNGQLEKKNKLSREKKNCFLRGIFENN